MMLPPKTPKSARLTHLAPLLRSVARAAFGREAGVVPDFVIAGSENAKELVDVLCQGDRVELAAYLIRKHIAPLLAIAFLSALGLACGLYGPLALRDLIDAIARPEFVGTWDIVPPLLGLTALPLVGLLILGVRGALTAALTRQVAVALSETGYALLLRCGRPTGEHGSHGRLVSLLASDAPKAASGMQVAEAAMLPLAIIGCCWLLFDVAGYAGLSGIAIVITSCLMLRKVERAFGELMPASQAANDLRLNIFSEALANIKAVKLMAWERFFVDRARGARSEQERLLLQQARVGVQYMFFYSAVPLVAVAVVIGLFIWTEEKLLLGPIFASIALLGVLRGLIARLPEVIESLIGARTSLSRLASFYEAVVSKPDAAPAVALPELPAGQLIGICGRVGAGKSTLLLAMAEAASRSAAVRGARIGYAPQEPWILGRSLRENITMDVAVLDEDYRATIAACALTTEVGAMPEKDATPLGDRGLKLSGGQKRRVALARAALGGEEHFFDDPLNSLDQAVADAVFDRLLLGRLAGRTRVLVTNDLRHLHRCDLVLFVEDRSVAAIGAPADVLPGLGEIVGSRVLPEVDEEAPASPGATPEISDVDGEDEVPGEGKSTVRLLGEYVTSLLGRRIGIVAPLVLALSPLMVYLSNLWLSHWAEAAALSHASGLGTYLTLCLGAATFACLQYVMVFRGGVRSGTGYQDKLMTAVLQAPIAFFERYGRGAAQDRMSADVQELDHELAPHLVFCAQTLLTTVLGVGTVVVAAPALLALYIPIGWILGTGRDRFLGRQAAAAATAAQRRARQVGHVNETLEGLSAIRCTGVGALLANEYGARLHASFAAGFDLVLVKLKIHTRLELLGMGATCSVGVLAAFGVTRTDPAFTALALTTAFMLTGSLAECIRELGNMESSISALRRIDEMTACAGASPQRVPAPSDWPRAGRIRFEGLTVQYPSATTPTLQGIDLDVEPGEWVAFVGRTGAGKSTLVNALLGVVPRTAGRILVDGVDLETIDAGSYREKFAVMTQDIAVFSGSIRFNLDPAGLETDEELWQALRDVALADRVGALPGGLDAVYAPDGEPLLSVGERQLLAVARLLIRRASIVLLDEATAYLDPTTFRLLLAVLRKRLSGSTLIIITHRPEEAACADRVIEIAGGRLLTGPAMAATEGGLS